jgi:hypothetical protein
MAMVVISVLLPEAHHRLAIGAMVLESSMPANAIHATARKRSNAQNVIMVSLCA